MRLWLVTTDLGIVDGDEAVVGLMALDWLDGRASTFYWGQFYGGSQESLLTAALSNLVSVATALKLVPVLLHATGVVLTWRIGRRTVGGVAAGVGAALVWLWPAAFVWGSTKARGQYGMTLVCGLAAVLLLLRIVQDDPRGRARVLLAGGAGLAAGVAWWASPQAALTIVPAAIWYLAARGRAVVIDAAVGVPAALAGAAPWLRFNVNHSFASFDLPPVVACAPTYGGKVEAAFTSGLPQAIGARLPYAPGWAEAPVAIIVCAIVAAVVAGAAAAAVRDRDRGLALVVAVVVAYPFLFAISPYFYVDEPRYFYFLGPYLALTIGWALARAPRPRPTVAVAVGTAACISAAALVTMAAEGFGRFAAGDVLVPRDLSPIISALRARGHDRVITPYALAYRITLDSHRDVLATPIEHIRDRRINDRVRSSGRPAWVFLGGSEMVGDFQRAVRRRGAVPGCVRIHGAVMCEPDRVFLQEDLPELQPGFGERRRRC